LLLIAAGCLPIPKPLAELVRSPLIRVIAKSVSEFVAHGKIEKLIKANSPLRDQLHQPSWLRDKQNVFEKRLTTFQNAEGRAVWIHVSALENWFPILRMHQDPGPLTQIFSSKAVQSCLQGHNLFFTI